MSYLCNFVLNKKFCFKLLFLGLSNIDQVAVGNNNELKSQNVFVKKLVKKYVGVSVQFKKMIDSNKNNISVAATFFKKVSKNWPVRFSGSNVLKYFNTVTSKASLFFYLRKNKSFIKGRYSKNRAYYRTGVYWCLYIHAIAILAFYYWFYRFTLNFGYLWWMFFVFAASFVFAAFLRIDGFNISNFFIIFFKNLEWFFFIIYSLFTNIMISLYVVADFFKKSKMAYFFFF